MAPHQSVCLGSGLRRHCLPSARKACRTFAPCEPHAVSLGHLSRCGEHVGLASMPPVLVVVLHGTTPLAVRSCHRRRHRPAPCRAQRCRHLVVAVVARIIITSFDGIERPVTPQSILHSRGEVGLQIPLDHAPFQGIEATLVQEKPSAPTLGGPG